MSEQATSLNDRIEIESTNGFHTITTAQGEYELWNSITKEQEKEILEQLALEEGSLPLSKKDGEHQRLLFGKGSFGKVRLARKKDGKFYAVKKIPLIFDNANSIEVINREHEFGKFLARANIPHVAYSVDSEVKENKRGEKKLYLFMNKVGSLGNGDNLKRLLGNLNSSKQRDAILKHAAISLLESVAAMHKSQIAHRDLKASNLLVSSTGEIDICDFGGGVVYNEDLIREVLDQDDSPFEVSKTRNSDMRYLAPDIHLAIKQNLPLHIFELDNWRVGLTLLQLCGCIKEGEGILQNIRHWVEQINTSDDLEKINERYYRLIQEIKEKSLHKIPQELRDAIFGLLEIKPEERKTAEQALELIPPKTDNDVNLISQGFKNLTHIQAAQATKKYIKQALDVESQSKLSSMWSQRANKAFKMVLHAPNSTVADVEAFIGNWISEINRPDLSHHQLQVMLDLAHQKQLNKQQPLEEEHPPSTWTKAQPLADEHPPRTWTNGQPPTGEHPARTWTNAQPSTGEHPARTWTNAQPSTGEHPVHTWANAQPSATLALNEQKEEEQLVQLEGRVKNSVDDLLEFVKKKVSPTQFESLRQQTVQNLNMLLQRIKKYIRPSRIFGLFHRKSNNIQISINNSVPDVKFDEKAFKAVLYRQQQIVSQLTIDKLYSLSDSERFSVYQMLEKDKQFLIDIMLRSDVGHDDTIHQIDEKLQLLDFIEKNKVCISLGQANNFPNNASSSQTFVAEDERGEVKYTFSQIGNMVSYDLVPKFDQAFRNFVASKTVVRNTKSDDIYIYAANPSIGQAIAEAICHLIQHPSQFNIYVNGQKMIKKAGLPTVKNLAFFQRDSYRQTVFNQSANLKIRALESDAPSNNELSI